MFSKKLIVPGLIFLLAFSCSEKDPPPSISKESKTASPKITVLATLPDSSKPVKIFLKKPGRKIKAGKPIIHAFVDSNTHMVLSPEEQAQGFFTNYTVEDGLPLESTWGSIIDKDGNLWFGTDGGGVSRYDGKTFTNYTIQHGLLSNIVLAIRQARNGDLWFGTALGVSRFDGRRFTNYTAEDGLGKGGISWIFEDRFGDLWFGIIGGGLSHFDGKKFHNLTTAHGLADDNVRDITEDKPGSLWIATAKGLCHYDGKRFYTLPQFRNHHVESVAKDDHGNLWVGTGIGVFRYNAREFGSDSATLKFPAKTVMLIKKDRAGNLWMAAAGDGVIRYDGGAFTRFTTANGLPINVVISISEDKTGNLWFATGGGGIVRYGGKSFMNYTAAFVFNDDFINGMIEGKAGDLWFGTNGRGVSRYDGKSISTYTESQGLINNTAHPFFKDKKGNLWFTAAGGVSCFDGETFTNYTQANGFNINYITCMAETRGGKIWFGRRFQGATCYDGNGFINYSEINGLPVNFILCITEDAKGDVWFGTPEGLSRFDGSNFINYTTANGLPHNQIYCSAMDRSGNLWFGTEGGLSRFDGKSFMNFTVGPGLPDNNVWAIVIDSTGKIIAGTNSGLAVLVQFNGYPATEKKSLNRPAQNDLKNDDLKNYTPQFEIYNLSAGYPIKDVVFQGMIQDSKGNLWMRTGEVKNKLIRFDYSSVHKNKEPAIPVLHNVKIHNETVCWNNLLPHSLKSGTGPHITEEATTLGFILTEEARDSMRSKFKGIKFDSIRRFYPIPENLVLPYRHNNVSIDFGSVELNRPNLVKYQYILEGYDKEWSPVTNRTSVTFGNIHEGTYDFKLRAQSPFGIWSDPVVYTFKVLPPWWRTWWFKIMAAACIIASGYALMRWRLQRKFRLQLERSQNEKQLAELQRQKVELEMQALRAQMNPHFIFNSLNSINRFILQSDKLQASEYLSKFSKLIRLILQNSQATLTTLESELEALRLYLELERLRFDDYFGFKIVIGDELDTEIIKIPPLIIQPFAENAIWHGLMNKEGKGHLQIELFRHADMLCCKITDDGVGRMKAESLNHKSAMHKSMGLHITEERIAMLQEQKQINSSVQITDLVLPDGTAGGTEVLLKVPLIIN